MAQKLMFFVATAIFSVVVVATAIPSESQAEKTVDLPFKGSDLAQNCETSQQQYGTGRRVGLLSCDTFDCILELDTTYQGSIVYKNALVHKSVLIEVQAHGMKNRTLSIKKLVETISSGDECSLAFELIFPSEDFSNSVGIYLISVTVRDAEDARAFDVEACLDFPVYLNTSAFSSASMLMLIIALVVHFQVK